uniref:Cold-Shock Protein n=1 Tax=Florenciella sp. virus SA2 TaxID=3240092 RepID=A0AB39J9J2_9VIRU
MVSVMYQVKWFSKKKGYGFVESEDKKEYFVHHTDIQVDNGFRYLKQGEYVVGVPETMEGDKVKLGKISPPMEGGLLMCEVEKQNPRFSSNVAPEED